ncbi:unnamed protein product [Phytomonas sp. EM1]|nr:unnamed protein product [Phytomonas sp. EM1]|eukprot:CCW60237.1 unnamed protein product [Phytomonas sp. isolate EM1]
MSQYIQLLGTDTPNSFGGCCYYGLLDHPGLQSGPALPYLPPSGFPAPATYQNLLQLPLEAVMARFGGSPELNFEDHSSFPAEKMDSTDKNSSGKKSIVSASGGEGYLFFNCPEGTQRFSSEANIKLTKIKGFFFTRWGGRREEAARTEPLLPHSSENRNDAEADDGQCGSEKSEEKGIARCETPNRRWVRLTDAAASAGTAVMGLPGLLFTINDAGVRQVNVFGPSSAQLALQEWLSKLKGGAAALRLKPAMGDASSMRGDRIHTPRSHGRATLTPLTAGLEQFLAALRLSYFSYRPMVFRMLTPTFSPLLSGLNTAIQKSTLGLEKEDPKGLRAAYCSPSPSTQPIVQTTSIARDEIFLLPPFIPDSPTSSAHKERSGSGLHADAERPFLVAVLPLSAQSVLIAFRVSGGVARTPSHDRPPCEPEDPWRETASSIDATEGETAFAKFLPDLSEMVLGYAIVNAPMPAFDVGRARGMGVRPGPKYAQLKQGIAVFADDGVGVADRKPSRLSRRAGGLAAASSEGISARTPECGAEAVGALSAGEGSPINPDADPAVASSTQRPSRAREPQPGHPPRLVQPHEVTVPTIASRHLYVSLVLDGNHATDVRVALERLLGSRYVERGEGEFTRSREVDRQTESRFRYEDASEDEVRRGCFGELIRVLHQWFPGFAYAPLSASLNDDTCGSVERRQLRTVVIRHVVHVQPLSYFKVFNAELYSSGDHPRSSEVSVKLTTPSSLVNNNIYHAYLNTIFETVHPSVRRSCLPMMSFTMADLVEGDLRETNDHDSGAVCEEFNPSHPQISKESPDPHTGSPSRPDLFTKHLFTAFVQQHFTAFPTALVHRYHLRAIAPGSFPVPTRETHPLAGVAGPSAAWEPTSRPFWPYSFKLDAVPPHHGRPLGLSSSASASEVPPAKAIPANGGGAPYIRYPDASSALALLSTDFHACLRCEEGREGPAFSKGVLTDGEEGGGGGGALGFLGTGSAIPSKYRNVSGTFFELELPACCWGEASNPTTAIGHGNENRNENEEEGERGLEGVGKGVAKRASSAAVASNVDPFRPRRGVWILDFGEGSAGQLAQLFARRRHRVGDSPEGDSEGIERSLAAPAFASDSTEFEEDDAELARFVLDVEVVFISHGHADHHLGLLSFLSLRHYYLEYQKGMKQERQSQSTLHACYPFMEREPRKLLVVLPGEVYEFMKFAWFDLWPYQTWIEEECEFDIIPPIEDGESFNTVAAFGDALGNAAGGLDHPPIFTTQDRVEMAKAATLNDKAGGIKISHSQGGDFQASSSTGGVTCPPRLQALLRRWNAAMDSHFQPLNVEEENEERGRWEAQVLKVDHPANAHALLLRFPSASMQGGRRGVETSRVLLFSGDTRPCPFLVDRCRAFCARSTPSSGRIADISKNVDDNPLPAGSLPPLGAPFDVDAREGRVEGPFICLHEATFGPGFEAEAISKKHSTLPEALDIGAQTASEFVVLNHFSQRYPKLPGLTEAHFKEGTTDVRLKRSRPRGSVDPLTSSPIASASLGEPPKEIQRGDRDGGRGGLAEVEDSARGNASSAEEFDDPTQGVSGVNGFPQGFRRCAVPNVSFAFDLMRLSFSDLRAGTVASRLPIFVRLLEEYESWGVGTTQRLRERA